MSANHLLDLVARWRNGEQTLELADQIAEEAHDQLVISNVVLDHRAIADEPSGTKYTPIIEVNGIVGYQCHNDDGRTTYLYFNPSNTEDDGKANVFVYSGGAFDPTFDMPLHWYGIWDEPTGVSS